MLQWHFNYRVANLKVQYFNLKTRKNHYLMNGFTDSDAIVFDNWDERRTLILFNMITNVDSGGLSLWALGQCTVAHHSSSSIHSAPV